MSREMQDIFDSGEITDLKIGGTAANDSVATIGDLERPYSTIAVAQVGGDFNTIQAAIDFAVTEYPARSLNSPVVITVAPGEYREQIHSYSDIVIQSLAAAYDPVQGQAKATIINVGDAPGNYPLRTEIGDVYYMIGISIYTDTVDGVLGRLPEGTFKNCSTRYGHFIENDLEFTHSQFKDCKFNNNTYGGFYVVSAVATSGNNIKLDRCILKGTPTFLSTHPDPSHFGFIFTQWSEVQGSLHIAGDWGIQGFQLRINKVATRNIFDTSWEVKFEGGYMVNGIHFISAPSDLYLGGIAFESIADNQIPVGETDITADVTVTGNISGNIMHNGLPAEVHMDNPDKFVGTSQRDGYISVKAALDSITDNDADHRYTIQVSAGVYVEDNPIQGKEYVNLKAIGDLQTTRIEALNPTNDLLAMVDLFTIEGFTLWGVTGAAKYAVTQTVAGISSITRCLFGDCTNGVLLNNAGAVMAINDCSVYSPVATTVRGVYCRAGALTINTLSASLGNITKLLEVTGVDSVAVANNVNTSLSTVTTGISIRDLAQADINSAKLSNLGTAIEAEGGAHVHISGFRVSDVAADGIRVNDIGSDTVVSVESSIIEGSVGYDVNLLSATSLIVGTLTASLNNMNTTPGNRSYIVILDLEEEDEGLTILGEFHVGSPESPTESVFGEGDSYTRGLLAYTWDGTAYVDISTSVRSPSSSPFTFPNTTIGTAIYLASDLIVNSLVDFHKFFGIKLAALTAQIGGEVVAEYYNGSSWVEFSHMISESSGSYYRKADNLFTVTPGSYQLRFNPAIDADWTKTDAPSIGDEDRYWMRFRITSSPSTLPVFEQFKLHSSRHEINADGFGEDMGFARSIVGISVPWSVFQDAAAKLGNQDLYVSDNSFAGMANNVFTIAGESIGTIMTMPPWVDTSAPLVLVVKVVCDVSGTLQLKSTINSSVDGDTIAYATPGSVVGEVSDTVSQSVVADEQITYAFQMDISDKGLQGSGLTPETLWINLEADVIPGGASIFGMVFDVAFLSWRSGSHI
jgi:pectin methylesterase-like acyl-CoA thioesterase